MFSFSSEAETVKELTVESIWGSSGVLSLVSIASGSPDTSCELRELAGPKRPVFSGTR